MAQYGLPYKGSKSKIAQWVIDILPSAQVLYDIFAGGCVCIAEREVACSMSVIKRGKAIEKIFRPKHQVNGNR